MENHPDNFKNGHLLRFIIDRKFKAYRHIVLIVFLAAVVNAKETLVEPANTYAKSGAFIVSLGLLYFNIYWLIPKYLFRELYYRYFLWIMELLGIVILVFITARHFLRPFFRSVYKGGMADSGIVPLVFVFFVFIAASAAIRLFQRSIVMNQRVNELERLKIRSELEQLKNQINPHFLFNTLNNANVLTQRDPEKASHILMRLSHLLRYQLYDSSRNKVLLSADVRFLEDFLNLENIRRDKFSFKVCIEGSFHDTLVSPLLFIIFVENAIKHNVDAENESYVFVSVSATEHGIVFTCRNSKPAVRLRAVRTAVRSGQRAAEGWNCGDPINTF